MEDEKGFKLHPAAAVFRDKVVGEIGEENKRLREDISGLQPHLDYIQKVEITAASNDEPITMVKGKGVFHGTTGYTTSATVEIRTIATVRLDQGSLVDDGRVLIPITSAPQLILKNLGFGIGISIANVNLGRNSLGRGAACTTTVAVSEDNNRVGFTIFLSGCASIHGDLQGLNNEDVIAFKEGTYPDNHLDILLLAPSPYS